MKTMVSSLALLVIVSFTVHGMQKTAEQTLNEKLMHALHDNITTEVRDLIAQGADVNCVSGICGYTPLHLARGRLVDFFIKRGARLDARLTSGKHAGFTPLELALYRGMHDSDQASKAKKLVEHMRTMGEVIPDAIERKLNMLAHGKRYKVKQNHVPAKRMRSIPQPSPTTIITITIPAEPISIENLPPLPDIPPMPTVVCGVDQNVNLRSTSDTIPRLASFTSVSSWPSFFPDQGDVFSE